MTDEFNPSPRLGDRLESLEQSARNFGTETKEQLLRRLAGMGLQEKAQLYRSLRSKLNFKQGDLEGIAWSFARHGIFVEHGVGKHRPKGSSFANKYARPWLRPVLTDAVEQLADLLAEEYADIVAGEIVIRIPGVIDTTIK